jgi:hypothetical protein
MQWSKALPPDGGTALLLGVILRLAEEAWKGQ